MSRYAGKTTVPVSRSKAELEQLLRSRGAKQIAQFTDDTGFASVQFFMRDRLLRFSVEMPPVEAFSVDRSGYMVSEARQRALWEQEERRRWRVLILTIKARLEEVDNEIATFDEAFLSYIVLPDNRTIADALSPVIEEAYKTGRIPNMRDNFLALPAPRNS